MKLKTIAITMGDPGSIGPEVIVKALTSDKLPSQTRFVIIGNKTILFQAAKTSNLNFKPKDWANQTKGGCYFLHLNNIKLKPESLGRPTAESGQAAWEYILTGIDLVQKNKADALVTGPVSKEAINLAGYPFTGHTELLAQKTRARKVVMMLVAPCLIGRSPKRRLRMALVTTHLAFKKVPLHLNTGNILSVLTITAESLQKYFGFPMPRLGVCGLNPHAGEAGWLGQEEKNIITPAVELAKKQGIACSGPLPADSIFHRAIQGEFEAVIAMYHDQGVTPIKTIGFEQGVNVTLGLPIIRTSVIHGTAFDIAGKGIANPDSMTAAIRLACEMSQKERKLF